MKRLLALLVVVLTVSNARAAQNPKYKLYYLDKTRNVCSVGIGENGKAVAQPQILTSGGGYHGYSVSPDGSQVFGCKQIGVEGGEFPVFKCFLERGERQARIPGTVSADGTPWAEWSPNKKYLIIRVPGQVSSDTIIYSIERCKIVCDTMDLLPDFCADQTYSFVLEDRGDDDNSPAWLRMLDMTTGKMTKVTQVNFGVYGDTAEYMWLGGTHKFAFIDVKGNVGAGEVSLGKSRPMATKRMLTKCGGCSDLRYVPGKGVYFAQKTGTITKAYYSRDLRALAATAVLPAKHSDSPAYETIRDGRVYSPDNRLYATAEADKTGQMAMIRVYDKSGHAADIVQGTRPRWSGGQD